MALNVTSILCFLISLVLIFCHTHGGEFATKIQQHQNHFHAIGINSFFPATVCSTSNKDSRSPQRLKLAHGHGPCSPIEKHRTKTPSPHKILLQDLARVNSIQSRTSNRKYVKDSDDRLPVTSGYSLGTSNFIVTLGFGTPTRNLPIIFDTGSSLTWIQCQPCVQHCYEQRDPIFNPSNSSSYSNISCNSKECSEFYYALSSCNSTCTYGIQYGDDSYTVGYFASETLTFPATSNVFCGFQFGCGHDNDGLFGEAAGIFGLGRNKISFIYQTEEQFGKKFSYCLPQSSSSTGFLAFGKQAGVSSTAIQYTPLITKSDYPSFYFLGLTGISVAGERLSISPAVFSSPGTIIDSGTVLTYFPSSAYSALRSAFRKSMSNYTTTPSPYSLLDTCYDFSGNDPILVPKIVLHFEGGTDVEVDESGIFFGSSISELCLAFAANSESDEVSIFGNRQQKTLEVVYDVKGEKIGFGIGGCSS